MVIVSPASNNSSSSSTSQQNTVRSKFNHHQYHQQSSTMMMTTVESSNSPINHHNHHQQQRVTTMNTMTCYDRAAVSLSPANIPPPPQPQSQTSSSTSTMMITNFSMAELQEIQLKISSIQETFVLQRIVDLIEERNNRSSCFTIIGNCLQFDLMRLDSGTLAEIRRLISNYNI
ncbi:serine-rich adhesin for platelets-like [Dermatophagoides farinae]|uniref:Serine-rich adhesin for platelets-like n=1 Tax=Dermatophagoides farinae TaxID=6954 RepID=A0A9D4SJ05_DERFA|nr:serine-rich adhesin for platelets-like [Dermatophagoides farinae]